MRTKRDNQQWMLDLALNMRGRVQNFERDDPETPTRAHNYRMLPKMWRKKAEHDEAFDELHDSVIEEDSTTDDDEALKVTIGSGLTGAGVDPPPPPPPHAVIKRIERIRNGYFLNIIRLF